MGHVIRFSSISDIFENTSLECSFQKKRTVSNLSHSFTITTKMRMIELQGVGIRAARPGPMFFSPSRAGPICFKPDRAEKAEPDPGPIPIPEPAARKSG